MNPQQSEECRHRVAELLATRPVDGRSVALRENRGGWRYTGLSGTCERLSDDGQQMVLSVEHDPEDYWPPGIKLLVQFDHETQPFFREDLPMPDLLSQLRAELLYAAKTLADAGRPVAAQRLREAAARKGPPCGHPGCSGHVDTLLCGECRSY